MQPAAKIAGLRASLARAGLAPSEKWARAPLGCRSADALLDGGLQRGALHEIFAQPGHEAAATGFILALARRLSAHKHLLWIRHDFSALEHGELTGTGLLEFGLDPGRVLELRVADAADAVRAANDALSCTALGAVLIELSGTPKILDLVTSRRLTLASAQQGVTALLLRFGAQPGPSTAETRWLVRSHVSPPNEEDWGKPQVDTALVRNRRGPCGQWVMEWDCNNGSFRETHSRASAAAPPHRPIETAVESIRQAG
jgi:protein ImuA